MAFRFPLESVLRLRAGYERQEQARLEIAARSLYAALERCESLRKEKTALEETFRRCMLSGMAGDELQYFRSARAGLEIAQAEAADAALKTRKLWDEQRLKFLAARQDREVIASVKQRQHREYREKQARYEQQQVDDLFSMRRNQPNG
jgi:flagellar export protein FliJ